VQEYAITPSLEDYIEAIYVISNGGRQVRVTEISKKLAVRKSSVTGALKILRSLDIIEHSPYKAVTLTRKGEYLGRRIFNRHLLLKRFFTDVLGVEEEKAEETACRVEHALDEEVVEKLSRMFRRMESCPLVGSVSSLSPVSRNDSCPCACSGPKARNGTGGD